MKLPPKSTRSNWIALIIVGLFLLPVMGARLWLTSGEAVGSPHYVLTPRSQPATQPLKIVPLSESALEVLATTNILNGDYLVKGQRISVFAADWRAKNARQMSVVQHTPDICWIGAGYTALDLGQPANVPIRLGTNQLMFECRIMSAGAGPPEMTLWCTLVGGRPLEEGFRFSNADLLYNAGGRTQFASRLRGLNMFFRAVESRTRSDGTKQFVRISTQVRGAWEPCLVGLQEFLSEWLELEYSPPGARKSQVP